MKAFGKKDNYKMKPSYCATIAVEIEKSQSGKIKVLEIKILQK